jgi:hypothetical protein
MTCARRGKTLPAGHAGLGVLVLAAALITRFARTGGIAMLRMMGGSPDGHEHDHMDADASHTD